ncbi:MAG: ATP-binding protein [Bacillota bacterium]|nr:ATP-binding protein [Bacillota bacterium]
MQQVIEQLESTQVVLLSGPAGTGKSAIAKDVVGILEADHFVFTFRAEEFAHPSFDETLQNSQIPTNATTLGAILAGQDRKVLLVESVERLLEKSTRDAFTDLLTLIARDRSWRVILTCRDYSTDLVRTALLRATGVDHSVVAVPPLDDAELQEIEAAYPMIARPLANVALRRLLRNPYVLDKAVQIPWSGDRSLPRGEREFRALFWQQIVRVDQCAAGGMPRRREETFVQIALRRARALNLYAQCGDLDPEVVGALRRDSLIVSSPDSEALAAPAHDVLEDWAILRWIDEYFATHEGSVEELSAAIGTHPAIRRTYRKWVRELVERDPGTADRVFRAAVHEGELPDHFRDDTLASLLRSSASAAFLDRHRAELFANDKQLLRRVIHLLRVACVTTPNWLGTTVPHASLFNVPDGPAWACTMRLVQGNLELFTTSERALLLGLIEDWSRGVSSQDPYPEGAESVAAIAHWLLPAFDDYRSDDQRRRTLRVIAKIPAADRERFVALLQGSRGHEKRDRATEDFREIIFEGLEGAPAARDMPEAVVSAAKDYLLCSEADLRRPWDFPSGLELETLFGIKRGRSFSSFPASAYRGPFLQLLRHHANQGLDFIIAVFNHSADWYANPRVGSEHIEPPFEMRLTFADGTSRTQWCNARLWNLYRGTSVGPYVLQSLLMALERWLLEYAEAYPSQLDKVLLHILRQSDSAALTAVAASVATAFPHASGETLLVLLRSPLCFQLDRQRLASESQAPSRLSGLMPRLSASDMIYEEERKEADALPHRGCDLETAIANLQLGPLATRVHEILDRHRAEMPPVEEQDENDRIWRLAIHRMDLRQYTVVGNPAEPPITSEDSTSPDDDRQSVRLEPNVPEPDVKEMVDQSAARLEVINARLGLLMWGLSVFRHEEGTTYDPAQWQQRLQEARTTGTRDSSGEQPNLGRGGPGFVAAVCVRDHWEEMLDDEREWCVNTICSEVERDGDNWNRHARVQRYSMSPDRACASVIPLLLVRSLTAAQRSRVRHVFVTALTHAIDEVRWYTACGVGRHLCTSNRDLALRCVNALATEAMLVRQAANAEFRRPYEKRRQLDEIEAEAAALARSRFFEANGIADDAFLTMDPADWFGAEANRLILTILRQMPTDPASVAAFQRLATTLVKWWDSDDERRRDRHRERSKRNYQTESVLTDLLEDFVLRTTATEAAAIMKPIVDATDRHPEKVHRLMIGLIGVEDLQPNTPQFWSLWELFADRIRHAKWLADVDEEHAHGSDLISAIFLGTWWKEEVRHWRSLEGHAWRVHALFEELPASSTVLDAYLRFLYHVGEQSLPDAFILIARRLQQGNPRQMMRRGNTVFLLETLLQRYVYGRPLELKRQRDLREAVLFLLDSLVENGSSAAFRMRDDFVTPASIT